MVSGDRGRQCDSGSVVRRRGSRRQATSDVAAQCRPGTDPLCAESNADSRGSRYALLGWIERAAVSVWLWPELHELLAWGNEDEREVSEVGRVDDSVDRRPEHWQGDGGSGGAALYASALGEFVAAGAGAQRISAHRAKAWGTADG